MTLIPSPLVAFAFRLSPGADLKRQLLAVAAEQGWQAAAIVSAVGSLSSYHLRFAAKSEGVSQVGDFEILSLVGTLSATSAHLHLGVADGNGTMTGGHVLDGCVVRTTAEIVVAELRTLAFTREPDPATGYRELRVRVRS